ncbi:hypothetical protein TNCV_880451 [Trichonephila clavipes]|nr:hypothetical protein TNCV_880451 [Trichonephila clavipes]
MVSSHMPWIVCLSIYLNVGTICVTVAFKVIHSNSFQTALASMGPFAIIVELPCKACVPFSTRMLFETYKSERCFEHISFVMDPIDTFPEHISITVVPVTLPDKPVALEYSGRQGQVRAAIIYQEPNAKPTDGTWTDSTYVPEQPVQIPEPPVQIPQSHVQSPPVPIPDVPEPPVQIPDVPEPVQIPQVLQPIVQIPVLPEPVQIPDLPEPVQIPQVPQPTVKIPDVPEAVQIPDVPEAVQISDVPEAVQIPEAVQFLHVAEPMQIPEPVQILHVPEPMQIPPELHTVELDPLEPRDIFDQLIPFLFGPPAQELQLLHTVPSIFDGDLISFLDEFEREFEPMDFTMLRLKPCVEKSIGFKAIQPMDLSVNSCL